MFLNLPKCTPLHSNAGWQNAVDQNLQRLSNGLALIIDRLAQQGDSLDRIHLVAAQSGSLPPEGASADASLHA